MYKGTSNTEDFQLHCAVNKFATVLWHVSPKHLQELFIMCFFPISLL